MRPTVLMSTQPLFDTLAIEVARDQMTDIPSTETMTSFVNERIRARPAYPTPEVMDLLENWYGAITDDDKVEPAKVTAVVKAAELTDYDKRELPLAKVVNDKRVTKKGGRRQPPRPAS